VKNHFIEFNIAHKSQQMIKNMIKKTKTWQWQLPVFHAFVFLVIK